MKKTKRIWHSLFFAACFMGALSMARSLSPVGAAHAQDSAGNAISDRLAVCTRCHQEKNMQVNCRNKKWLLHLRKNLVDKSTFDLTELAFLGMLCSDRDSSTGTTNWGKDPSRKLRVELRCNDGRDNDWDGATDCDDSDCLNHPACQACACHDLWDPVCGVDGRTYGNDCEAACAGVKIAYHGECMTPSICGGIASFECGPGYVCDMRDSICGTADLAGICVPKSDVCPDVREPVCGCDGITYANNCERLKAGAVLAYTGPCPCGCPKMYAPVCGVDGKTYDNDCFAKCAGVEIAYKGQCGCICPMIYDPVCGTDGKTYGNACEAKCAGVEVAHRGECGCICPMIYDPVCGTDGKTYGNACEAKCAGVAIAYKGACSKMCGGIAGFSCPDGQTCNYIDPTCSIIDNAGTCVPKPDACIMLWDPVCGCDKITYSNDCLRIMAGVTLAHWGACKSCDDGSVLMCRMMVPLCPPGTVVAVQNNCYVCADQATCKPVPY